MGKKEDYGRKRTKENSRREERKIDMFSGMLILVAMLSFGQPVEVEPKPDPIIVKVYDISDLLVIIPDYTEVPQIDLQSALQARQGGQSPFRDTQQQNQARTKREAQDIMSLIQEFVEPEAWGNTATMTYWNGKLIIKAPKSVHDKI